MLLKSCVRHKQIWNFNNNRRHYFRKSLPQNPGTTRHKHKPTTEHISLDIPPGRSVQPAQRTGDNVPAHGTPRVRSVQPAQPVEWKQPSRPRNTTTPQAGTTSSTPRAYLDVSPVVLVVQLLMLLMLATNGALELLQGGPLAPQVVDQCELEQGGEDERRAHAHPDVDRLRNETHV